ncbi:hypothetical protein BDB00DRAFT_876343 [Zychaea mexicana]|uniref:uncharacterized protein n=1 Tax=Zychaea mexicana TaxID=64656 RepID=UPI0022FDBED6|nr:uncharacterized protein BDB00DRAFT_876343 [Zychaea mexicana]KAI9489469.1 hypothetical protein BDB00DRAFT_876343 [Zychaea mexicana]
MTTLGLTLPSPVSLYNPDHVSMAIYFVTKCHLQAPLAYKARIHFFYFFYHNFKFRMNTNDSPNASSPQPSRLKHPDDQSSAPHADEENTSGSDKAQVDASGSDADRSSQSKQATASNSSTNNDDDENKITDVDQAWTATWDANNQAYYWWNMVTYETTWENPLIKNPGDGKTEGSNDKVIKGEKEGSRELSGSPALSSENNYVAGTDSTTAATLTDHTTYPQYPGQDYSYSVQAYFNSRTGKFQAASEMERLNPEHLSIESRATRQMKYYFDVDDYTEQRNRDRSLGVSSGSKQRLSKKDVNRYKRAKQDKKLKRAREWLRD